MTIKQIFFLLLIVGAGISSCKKANIDVDLSESTNSAEGLKGDVYGI